MTKRKKQNLVGYLGPEGSFSHSAALKIPADKYVPYKTIAQLFKALRDQEVHEIITPFDNSNEGAVGETVDELIGAKGFLNIKKMFILPIEQNLVYVGRLEDIKKVISHQKALDQCSINIDKMGIVSESCSSTGAAIKEVIEKNDSSLAAIGGKVAIDLYGQYSAELGVIRNFHDFPDNFTRFAVIAPAGNNIGAGSLDLAEDSHDYVMTFRLANKSGQLKRIIDLISLCELNMVKLITRPSMANDPPASIRLSTPKEIKSNGKSPLEQFEDDSFLIIIPSNKSNEEIINKIIDFLEGLTLTEDFYVYGPYTTSVVDAGE